MTEELKILQQRVARVLELILVAHQRRLNSQPMVMNEFNFVGGELREIVDKMPDEGEGRENNSFNL